MYASSRDLLGSKFFSVLAGALWRRVKFDESISLWMNLLLRIILIFKNLGKKIYEYNSILQNQSNQTERKKYVH